MKNVNNITFTNIPECFNIKVIEGIEVSHKFDEHFHSSYNIGILRNGEAVFKIDKIEERINEETIYLINPKIIHSMVSVENRTISYTVINLEEKELNKIFKNENLIFRDIFIKDTVKSDKVIKCIERILNKNTFSIEKQEALIEILENAVGYIKANYKKK